MVDALAGALGNFDGPQRHRMRETGMRADFGWTQRARRYGRLYEQALADRAARLG